MTSEVKNGRSRKWAALLTLQTNTSNRAPRRAQAELDRERRKKGPAFQKATPVRWCARVLLVLLGLVLLYAGYILMDAWMDLHAMPAAQTDTVDGNTISTVALEAKAAKVDSLSLDGAVMLDAMMDDLSSGGYTAACFDIKRADGTVGYASTGYCGGSRGGIFPCRGFALLLSKAGQE